MERHLYNLLEKRPAGFGSATAVFLAERGGYHLVIERQHITRMSESCRELHESEDRLDLATVETVDVVDQNDYALAGLPENRLDTLP